MKILVFGSCNLDYVYRMEHIVRPGETLDARNRTVYCGGKGFNQAVAIARAGCSVMLAGCVGRYDSQPLFSLLSECGVDTTFLRRCDTPSGHAMIQVDDNGENAIFLYHGANWEVNRADYEATLTYFSPGDLLVVQNEIRGTPELIHLAHSKGMEIFWNPSPCNDAVREVDLDCVSCLICNEAEGNWITGRQNFNASLDWFAAKHPDLDVVLTLGSQGAYLLHEGQLRFQPAFHVQPRDTTGAGDTFAGYYIAARARGRRGGNALRQGALAAAIGVTRPGAAQSIPWLEELASSHLSQLRRVDPVAERRRQFVLDYIDAHLQQPLLDEVAQVLGYTKSYACRWVRTQFDRTFLDLVHDARCRAAAQLLREGALSVRDVSAQVGYTNETMFRTQFRRRYDCNPLAYKKNNRG